jgi:hypothetical protein
METEYILSFFSSCLYRASTVSKHFLLSTMMHTIYKITGILKQSKFRHSLRHVSVHAGTIIREPFLCTAKTTVVVLYPRRLWRGQCHGSIPTCCAGVQYTVEKGTAVPFSTVCALCASLWIIKSVLTFFRYSAAELGFTGDISVVVCHCLLKHIKLWISEYRWRVAWKEQNIMLLPFLTLHPVKITDRSRMNMVLFASPFETQVAQVRKSIHISNNFSTQKPKALPWM